MSHHISNNDPQKPCKCDTPAVGRHNITPKDLEHSGCGCGCHHQDLNPNRLDQLIEQYEALIQDTEAAKNALLQQALYLTDLAKDSTVAKEATSEAIVSAMHHPDVITFTTTNVHYLDYYGYEKINGTWYLKWKIRGDWGVADTYYTHIKPEVYTTAPAKDSQKIYSYSNGSLHQIAAFISGVIYYDTYTDLIARVDEVLNNTRMPDALQVYRDRYEFDGYQCADGVWYSRWKLGSSIIFAREIRVDAWTYMYNAGDDEMSAYQQISALYYDSRTAATMAEIDAIFN